MRLTDFKVEGLFGVFDHEISFRMGDRITIIHAPNGYGKTVILKLIEGFFGGTLGVFRQYEYRKITMKLDDGTTVTISQSEDDGELFPHDRPPSEARNFTIECIKGGERFDWDPLRDRGSYSDLARRLSPSMVDRYIPHVVRYSPGQWRDLRNAEVLTFSQVVDRYYDLFPPSVRRQSSGPHPAWLSEIRASIRCQLIETQRLMVARKEQRNPEREEPSLIPAVKTYSEDLAGAIGRALEESATLSQALDRTFPNRLLSRLRDSAQPLPADALRQRLAELEQLRVRLTKAGLLDKPDEDVLIPEEGFDKQTRRILTEYVQDAGRKLAVYINLLVKIELFTEILNSHFQFKKVAASRSQGFVFFDNKGAALDPSALSSGEQHELVLVYDLIFKTSPNSLILIDEPEISLHIAWQKRFLSDLQRIIALSPMDIVLSTHSPQLIGGRLDLAVQLEAPNELPDV